jgi:hypothetical protein
MKELVHCRAMESLYRQGAALHPEDSWKLLAERDPEAVQVPDNDLPHAVEHVVRTLHDLDSILDSVVKTLDVLGVRVQVDFATVTGTEAAARAEHHFARAERHHGEAQATRIVVVGHCDVESNVAVPVDSLSHVRYAEHWDDLFLHIHLVDDIRNSDIGTDPTARLVRCPANVAAFSRGGS